MDQKIKMIEAEQMRKDLPAFRPGDEIKVHYRVQEGNKTRVQVYQGTVIRVAHGGARKTFVVRKISFGVSSERSFPYHSPNIAKIEIIRPGKVRQARLYYLRKLYGKAARIKEAGY